MADKTISRIGTAGALAILVLAQAGCSMGSGTTEPTSLSPPAWTHGSWRAPLLPGVPVVLEISADNWIDNVMGLNVKAAGYDGVSDERATDTEYSFTYALQEGSWEGTISYLLRRSDTGMVITTAFSPTHPTRGDGTPQPVPLERVGTPRTQ